MHMNSVPRQLSREDRIAYERLLDETLRTVPHHPELAVSGDRFTLERLRAVALDASALITSAADAEYEAYTAVRARARAEARTDGAAAVEGHAGAGVLAVLTVLAPVLAGTAAVIFLLVGYVLRALAPQLAVGRTLLNTGWAFGALTAVTILIAGAGILVSALRNDATALRADAPRAIDAEVEAAGQRWREALRERGILPFLRNVLAEEPAPEEPSADPDPRTTAPSGGSTVGSAPAGRMPHLGYHRPGFSSPDRGRTDARPSYSRPRYSSPDFGGPGDRPE
ncbi:hypothetical protein [Streptomyces sp. NPDC002490]|uniref:hypothetical protein n=1 Tax=Streptomyces sp. NPDC002490 TaxID=3154416 RepID=UPI00331BFC07